MNNYELQIFVDSDTALMVQSFIDAITKGQSQSYISEKYGLSRSQYYKIKASV